MTYENYAKLDFSVHKVLLEHNFIHLVTYRLWLLLSYDRLSSCDRDYLAHEALNTCYLILYRKKKKNAETLPLIMVICH